MVYEELQILLRDELTSALGLNRQVEVLLKWLRCLEIVM